MVYVGIFRRAVALLIDIGVLCLVFAWFDAAGVPLGAMVEGGSTWTTSYGLSISLSWGTQQFVFNPAGSLLALLVSGLYFAGLEDSSAQATLGKRLLALRVTDLDGQRIGLHAASLRFFGRFISAWILFVGFIMAGFTQRKQALHDTIAGTVVIKRVRQLQSVQA